LSLLAVDFWIWPAFIALILFLIAVDLVVVEGEAHEVSISEAFVWSIVWTVIGVAFAGVILIWHGHTAAGEYIAGYVIERSLSVDNIFVFALILSYFSVPSAYQPRILVLGVLGAIFFRLIFIGAGAGLLNAFHWMIFVFGGFLVFTGLRMGLGKEVEVHPDDNLALKLMRRVMPITSDYESTRFFVKQGGIRMATPLLAVAIVIATTDVIFAVDSIPAIFAVTDNTFVVFSSNAFAVLGMRVMYFLLAGAMHRFVYLKVGLSAVLILVGVKMLSDDFYHLSIWLSLGIIGLVLAASIAGSLFATRQSKAELESA
jgi:TerC family integral membrane protein